MHSDEIIWDDLLTRCFRYRKGFQIGFDVFVVREPVPTN